MLKVKGWICLDIDGTITDDAHSVPKPVRDYLSQLYAKGWRFVFITGRSFAFARPTLGEISFPYLFSVQNGADLLQMPEKKKIHRNHLSYATLEKIEKAYEGQNEDYLIYAGIEAGDFCYYRPQRFSEAMNKHLDLLKTLVQEPWQELSSIEELHGQSFPLIKCLGTKEHMEEMHKILSEIPELNVTCIRDPLSKDGYYVNLVTDKAASKGNALKLVRMFSSEKLVFIAAGDDRNDSSMLEQADIAIAMETAPLEVLALADIRAPSAAKHGIIKGLEQAIAQVGS